ncbi:MAG: hypothetical protein A3J28_01505 [Acidobacteria bacterium RIFCSPLOWO2_12_FULL_60_22]|nr:MAG: hypothetical protein A3J28_01505 [Acidobacteria bacterium RIFCSPLOWO2_12_FULL_60_22]
MNREANREDPQDTERTYSNLVQLWTSGVRDFHSLLAAYLTANSIFVAAIGFLLSRQSVEKVFTLVVLVLCILGVLITLQMALVLARFDAQNSLWEWQLRGIERTPQWSRRKLFVDLYRFRDQKEALKNEENIPPAFEPNWILRQHRQWWARRAVSFPVYFGIIYGVFLIWSVTQLLS